MLNTTFVKFWQLSVSVPNTCVPSGLCLDVLHFCSVDVTSNLSHQLFCFIMLSYCSYFVIVYNYISLISCLFILILFYDKNTKKNSVFLPVFHTKQHKYKL